MEREEMIRILEEIARDPETNPTARVTAARGTGFSLQVVGGRCASP